MRYTHVAGEIEQVLKASIRDVPDFPKPGILFKDIAPVLADPKVLRQTIAYFVARYRQRQTPASTASVRGKAPSGFAGGGGRREPPEIDVIVGIEARGFIFGAPLACALGVPLQMARKQGKLPYATVEQRYDLEYGSATIALHSDAVTPGQRVLVIDDLLATGGTARATCQLVEKLGGIVAECAFVIELGFLDGVECLKDYDVCTLVKYA